MNVFTPRYGDEDEDRYNGYDTSTKTHEHVTKNMTEGKSVNFNFKINVSMKK